MNREELYQKFLLVKENLKIVPDDTKKYFIYDLYNLYSFLDDNEKLDLSYQIIFQEAENVIKSIFLEKYFHDQDYYQKLFLNIIEIYSSLRFPIIPLQEKNLTILTKEEAQAILIPFLKMYDLSLYELYKDLCANNRIICDPTLSNSQCYYLNTLKEGIISLKCDRMHLLTLSMLVHELGHLYEANFQTSEMFYYSYTSPFYEVSGNYFEFLFLNYLKNNQIIPQDSELLMFDFFNNLYGNCFDSLINTFFSRDSLIAKTCYFKPTFKEQFEVQKAFYNKIGILPYLPYKKFELESNLTHGLGALIGIYFADQYLENKNSRSLLEQFFKSYSTEDYNSLETLSLTKEELLHPKKLVRHLIDEIK